MDLAAYFDLANLSTEVGLRKRGQEVFVETCPQYLVLDDDCYQGDFEAEKYACLLPHSEKSDQTGLSAREIWFQATTEDLNPMGREK